MRLADGFGFEAGTGSIATLLYRARSVAVLQSSTRYTLLLYISFVSRPLLGYKASLISPFGRVPGLSLGIYTYTARPGPHSTLDSGPLTPLAMPASPHHSTNRSNILSWFRRRIIPQTTAGVRFHHPPSTHKHSPQHRTRQARRSILRKRRSQLEDRIQAIPIRSEEDYEEEFGAFFI